jgi:tetratricopeptide (TPR) repeat protein
MGRVEEAITVYRELLILDRDRAPDIYNELGLLYVQQSRYAEAAEAFREGLGVGGDAGPRSRSDLNFNLGVALKRGEKLAEATRAFSEASSGYLEAIQENPDSPSLHFALGNTYVEMREFQNAAEHFRIAAASNPADLQTHIHLAKSLEVQGRLHEAVEALKVGMDEMHRLGEPVSVQTLQSYRRTLEMKIQQGT